MQTAILDNIQMYARFEADMRIQRARLHETLIQMTPHTTDRDDLHFAEREAWTSAEKYKHTRQALARILRENSQTDREELDREIQNAIARGANAAHNQTATFA